MKPIGYRASEHGLTSDLALELGVTALFEVTEPWWYTRLTAHLRLTWKRELASVFVVFVVGLAAGWVMGLRS